MHGIPSEDGFLQSVECVPEIVCMLMSYMFVCIYLPVVIHSMRLLSSPYHHITIATIIIVTITSITTIVTSCHINGTMCVDTTIICDDESRHQQAWRCRQMCCHHPNMYTVSTALNAWLASKDVWFGPLLWWCRYAIVWCDRRMDRWWWWWLFNRRDIHIIMTCWRQILL